MTINIQSVEDEQRQLKISVDVSEERVQRAMREAARRLSRDLHIPGFRPGKAPYGVILRRIGEDNLRVEAIEGMTDEIFEEMLAELKISSYGQPTLDKLEVKPFQLHFTVPLEPIVDLGDYRSLRMKQEPVEVTEEAVNSALEYVRKSHEKVEPVERPSQQGDLLTVKWRGVYLDENGEEQVYIDDNRHEMILDSEMTFTGTTFVDHLVSLETGDDVSFELTFPEDYDDPDIAGRAVRFELTVLDVKEREVPALDDELAKLDGKYETLDLLRAGLEANLQEQAIEQARADLFDGMMRQIREGATLAYPPALIEAEVEERLKGMKEQVTRIGWEWEDYLRLQNQTEESLKEAWRDDSVEQIERNLVLLQLIENERLELTPEQVDLAIEERVAEFDESELAGQLRSFYETGLGRDRLRSALLMRMITDRVEEIADGRAPDLALSRPSDDVERVDDEDSPEAATDTPDANLHDETDALETVPESVATAGDSETK